mgnify:CR=1 FL=1
MMKNKSTIARLLAEEDIHVVSKKMDTAYFNIKKRELGLPIWKDEVSKVEEELMVCHEIGHALWTSMDMIKKSEARGLNSSFVNILEDARIEKFVKRKYPGSVNLFKKGYVALAARDFFGVANEGVNSCNLIDRINLFFKGQDGVEFSDDERVFVDRVEKLETEDEVLDLAEELYKYMEENQKEIREMKEMMLSLVENLMLSLTMPMMENLMKLLIMMGLLGTAALVMKTNLKMVELILVPILKKK